MNWFWLSLVYVLFLVCAELINKVSITDKRIDEVVFGASVQLTTGIFCLFLSFFLGWNFTFSTESVVLFAGMSITYIVAVSMYFRGLKHIDISRVSILSSLGSIWSLIMGLVILREQMTLMKVIGVLCIGAAGVVVSLKKQKVQLDLYTLLILGATVFYALGAVFDKRLNSYGTPLSYITLSFSFVGIGILLVFANRTKAAFKKTFKMMQFWRGILVNGALYSLGFTALFEAYNRGGEVSRLYPITHSTAVMVPILGIVILKERGNVVQKMLATGILLVGLWTIGK
ncbi:hypothetical protein A2154_04090 [Candidatus Gottesmanbacteria bacterium RBG_16_43_7]|uniref:EamA domain-containing protein n=1 Tax=Candidatus Gottesmanbacteria bacterium RBG_16_43_7 TaxID=1798373 RepID=A0A1F5Z936_9BACT|nr:MAG: hypothetical protein A2154_04090 [Candidatus Gottesmanbacteria bacterium RBG_16_43_7]